MHAKIQTIQPALRPAINRSRLRPPAERQVSIQRKCLEGFGQRIRQHRLTLFAAPAGYGKTMLMAQLAAAVRDAGHASCWFAPDAAAGQPATVLESMAVMLDELLPRSADTRSPELLLNQVCNAIADSSRNLCVFVDDFHRLPRQSAQLVIRLIEVAPDSAHFVVATRNVIGLPLARLRASGALLELGSAQLAFDESECTQLAVARGHSTEAAAELRHRTGGWPAGISLLLQEVEASSTPKRHVGLPQHTHVIDDFFAEEVFADLDASDRRLLTRTAILDKFCAPLCDQVTASSDSLTRLRRLSRSGLFLEPIDNHWYVCHPMFRAFLRGVLEEVEPGEVTELHRRASEWFREAGMLVAALDHAAETRDAEHLAQCLEASCEEMTYRGDIPVVARHANTFPEQVLDKLPRTLMTLAWLYTRQLRFDETRRLLQRVARSIEEFEATGRVPEPEIAKLRLMLEHRQTVLATATEEEMSYVDEQSENLIQQFGDTQPYITCTLYSQMLTARYAQFRLDDFSKIEPSARMALARSPYRFAGISLQATLGSGLFLAGRTQAAREALEHSLAEANRISGAKSGQAALPALPLARLLYECDERAEAERLIRDHLPLARQFGFAEQLHCGYLTLNRLRQAEDDTDGALRVLSDARRIVDECGLERLRVGVTAERIRFWLRQGRLDLASREGQKEGLDVSAEEIYPGMHSGHREELRAIAWVRLANGQGRLSDALRVAKRWRHFCGSRGVIRAMVRWCVLAAQVSAAQGDMVAAKRFLHAALAHSVTGRFIRSFVDEGPLVLQLILETYGGEIRSDDPIETFARNLLAYHPRLQETGVLEAGAPGNAFVTLTEREVAILKLVHRGLHNGEVGSRLGLTEGTVKWYMQQIYEKIGVRRRVQAVERARQLGLLN